MTPDEVVDHLDREVWLAFAIGLSSVTVDETIPPNMALFHRDGAGFLFTYVLSRR